MIICVLSNFITSQHLLGLALARIQGIELKISPYYHRNGRNLKFLMDTGVISTL